MEIIIKYLGLTLNDTKCANAPTRTRQSINFRSRNQFSHAENYLISANIFRRSIRGRIFVQILSLFSRQSRKIESTHNEVRVERRSGATLKETKMTLCSFRGVKQGPRTRDSLVLCVMCACGVPVYATIVRWGGSPPVWNRNWFWLSISTTATEIG